MNTQMSAREYEEYLASFDQDFADAPLPERSGGNVPDGKYQVKIDSVEIRSNQFNGGMELAMRLKVLDGPQSGRIIFHQREIDNPERMSYLRGDLNVCGLELQKLSELPRKLESLLDVRLDVQVKSKASKNDPEKIYQNVYLNKRLSDADGVQDDDQPW